MSFSAWIHGERRRKSNSSIDDVKPKRDDNFYIFNATINTIHVMTRIQEKDLSGRGRGKKGREEASKVCAHIKYKLSESSAYLICLYCASALPVTN